MIVLVHHGDALGRAILAQFSEVLGGYLHAAPAHAVKSFEGFLDGAPSVRARPDGWLHSRFLLCWQGPRERSLVG